VLSNLTLRYVDLGWPLFPAAGKEPLVKRWPDVATADIDVLSGWQRRWPYRQWGLAIPPEIVVADADEHTSQEHGIDDFRRLHGCHPRDVITPTALTRSGGTHSLFATNGRRYGGGRVPDTAICVKHHVGFVVLAETYADGGTNGYQWVPGREPWNVPLASAPAWLDEKLREAPTAPGVSAPLSDDLSVRQQGRAALRRACDRILAAQPGERDNVRHRECYTIGGLVGRGDVDEREAYDALLAACQLVPLTGGRPWHKLQERIEKSLAAGIKRPLPLSEVDQWMRHWGALLKGRVHA
jgi:hypothetical protein